MFYQWKMPSLHKVEAQTAGEELTRIAETEEGLTPKTLVSESRPEEAPLHPEFEWADEIAAELYREHQARNIINGIIVVPTENQPEKVRAFVNIIDSEDRRYKPLRVVLSQENDYKYMLATAKREMETYMFKWRNLKQLAPLFTYARELFESLDELEDVEDEEN